MQINTVTDSQEQKIYFETLNSRRKYSALVFFWIKINFLAVLLSLGILLSIKNICCAMYRHVSHFQFCVCDS